MKRIFISIFTVLLIVAHTSAQLFKTVSSEITFFSEAPLEDIAAKNNKAVSIFNSETGEIAISIPINKFQFKKSLMQEHFNEKYMESDKFPKATFKGEILNFDLSTDKQPTKARGDLTIHGVTREVELEGVFDLSEEKLFITTSFQVKLEDHKIKIPSLLFQNIAEIIDVKVSLEFATYSGKG